MPRENRSSGALFVRDDVGGGEGFDGEFRSAAGKPSLEDELQKDEGEQGQKAAEGMKRGIPLKRLGKPDDLPGIIAFLSSDDAAYITGQVISVSGGLTMAG